MPESRGCRLSLHDVNILRQSVPRHRCHTTLCIIDGKTNLDWNISTLSVHPLRSHIIYGGRINVFIISKLQHRSSWSFETKRLQSKRRQCTIRVPVWVADYCMHNGLKRGGMWYSAACVCGSSILLGRKYGLILQKVFRSERMSALFSFTDEYGLLISVKGLYQIWLFWT